MVSCGESMKKLRGQVAVVTGGAIRLGRAISLTLGSLGADVCVHFNRSDQAAREVTREIEAMGVRATCVKADLSSPVSASRVIVQWAYECFGRLDILINNAAIFEPGGTLDTSEELWDRNFSINLKAPFFLCQQFVRCLGDKGTGQIINIADWCASRATRRPIAYALTKAALVAMTKHMAVELAPRVRVNAIAPGAILPPVGQDDSCLKKIARLIPLGRTGTIDDFTAALTYLLHADFVTGEVLYVTGGQHL